MADIIDLKTKEYIQTFDCCDDPIVFTITRQSIYSDTGTICGVFDSIETAMCRLKRVMQSPRDGDKFIVETHNLRNLEQEQDLD
tara:strand:- start:1238 stop:1489 length:252 start_codon:yes stop_codon:yes gene_type:complete